MDSTTEDRLGTLIKMDHFISDNGTELAVNTDIEAQRVILHDDIDDIFENDSVATTPREGATEVKESRGQKVSDSIKLVRAACVGYYTANPDPLKMVVVNITDTFIDRKRDNDLYVLGLQVHAVADPIKTLLGPYLVTSGNVDDLKSDNEKYKDVLQLPRAADAVGMAAGDERDRLMTKSFQQTLVTIGNYLLAFKYVKPMVYEQYEVAKAIDDSGGGSDSAGYALENFVLAPGATVSWGPVLAPDKEVYFRQIGGNAGVIVCTAASAGVACTSGFTLTQGVTVKKPYGDLLLTGGTVINFTNPGTATLTLRAGLKE